MQKTSAAAARATKAAALPQHSIGYAEYFGGSGLRYESCGYAAALHRRLVTPTSGRWHCQEFIDRDRAVAIGIGPR